MKLSETSKNLIFIGIVLFVCIVCNEMSSMIHLKRAEDRAQEAWQHRVEFVGRVFDGQTNDVERIMNEEIQEIYINQDIHKQEQLRLQQLRRDLVELGVFEGER